MTLFATLSQHNIASVSSKSTKHGSPAYPPTAIQLYSDKYIHFQSNRIYSSSSASVSSKNNGTNNMLESRLNETSSSSSAIPKRYEILSYQAVYTPDSILKSTNNKNNGSDAMGKIRIAQENDDNEVHDPNLGIWDCYCDLSSASSSSLSPNNAISKEKSILLLNSLFQSFTPRYTTTPTFILTIDMGDISTIHSSVTFMIDSIIQYCKKVSDSYNPDEDSDCDDNDDDNIDHPNSWIRKNLKSTTGTPCSKLRSVSFGQAPNQNVEAATSDSKNDSTNSNIPPDANNPTMQHDLKVHIILCVILPPSDTGVVSTKTSATTTYKYKQTQHLLFYHFQKYASELNCTLCYLRPEHDEDTGEDEDKHRQLENDVNGNGTMNEALSLTKKSKVNVGLSVQEFSIIIRKVSLGVSPTGEGRADADRETNFDVATNEKNDMQDLVNDSNNSLQEFTSLYTPDSYDPELIDSVLLRNASCPGVWDANTDNLWVAIPPKESIGVPNTVITSGDNEWLSKLADSVSALTGINIVSGGSATPSTSDMHSVTADESVRTSKDSATIGTTSDVSSASKRWKMVKKKVVTSKKSDNTDVANFFEDLLKK